MALLDGLFGCVLHGASPGCKFGQRCPKNSCGGRFMKLEFVDADAHVVEVEFAPECLKRWPREFTFDPENRQIRTEGRRYPEFEGPGAGCPPEHGLSTADGINPYSPEGTLADAD